MLKNGRLATRLPAQDLERARAFYAEKLGLEPIVQREGGLRYVCAAGEFALFESAGAASGDHTQMGWEVDDIEATVRDLRARGVVFEEYDLPGLKTVSHTSPVTIRARAAVSAHGFATARGTSSESVSRLPDERPVHHVEPDEALGRVEKSLGHGPDGGEAQRLVPKPVFAAGGIV